MRAAEVPMEAYRLGGSFLLPEDDGGTSGALNVADCGSS
jgi:hypothetical protein